MAPSDSQPHFIFQAGRTFPPSGSWLYHGFSAIWAPAEAWYRFREGETHTQTHVHSYTYTAHICTHTHSYTHTHTPLTQTFTTHAALARSHAYTTHILTHMSLTHSYTAHAALTHNVLHPHTHTTHSPLHILGTNLLKCEKTLRKPLIKTEELSVPVSQSVWQKERFSL